MPRSSLLLKPTIATNTSLPWNIGDNVMAAIVIPAGQKLRIYEIDYTMAAVSATATTSLEIRNSAPAVVFGKAQKMLSGGDGVRILIDFPPFGCWESPPGGASPWLAVTIVAAVSGGNVTAGGFVMFYELVPVDTDYEGGAGA